MTDDFIGSRVRLEYDDHGEGFARHLPVAGRVVRRCTAATGPADWYLVELDEPLDYQHARGPNFQFERWIVRVSSRALLR